MSKEKERIQADRRGFLKLAGAGAVIGGAASVVAPVEAEAAGAEAREDGRYQETVHVKRYYDLARF